MGQHAMQHRSAPAERPAPATSVAGPAQAKLTQLAQTLNGAPAAQLMGKKKKPAQMAGLRKKPMQKAAMPKKKLMQHMGRKKKPAQRAAEGTTPAVAEPVQRAANRTGLPDQVKSGVESLSGMSMDHVRVHYNSPKPAQLNAHAYAQGSDIHVGPGQERHVPHEAWHVVQQAQGRVKPTMQMREGVPVNDDRGLEAEADRMGARALQVR